MPWLCFNFAKPIIQLYGDPTGCSVIFVCLACTVCGVNIGVKHIFIAPCCTLVLSVCCALCGRTATREAYLQLEPYWLSVFSVGQLMPRFRSFPARLVPGLCPLSALPPKGYYSTASSTVAVHSLFNAKVSDLIKAVINSTATVSTPYASAFTLANRNATNGIYTEYTSIGGDQILTRDITIWHNPAMIVALIVSFLLSGMLTAVAGGVFILVLQWLSEHFRKTASQRDGRKKTTLITESRGTDSESETVRSLSFTLDLPYIRHSSLWTSSCMLSEWRKPTSISLSERQKQPSTTLVTAKRKCPNFVTLTPFAAT